MFSEDALAEERILSGGYTVGGVGEVMECGLAVCKAVCCGAERFFSLVVCARGGRGVIIRPRMYMNL